MATTKKKAATSSSWDTLGPLERTSIALSALVDTRTLKRALTGDHAKVRPLGMERIKRALAERKLTRLLPKDARL